MDEIDCPEKGDFHFASFRINYIFSFGNYFVVKKNERKNPDFDTNINLQVLQ